MNYVELIQLQAMQVFGNKAKADIWLNQPKTTFDGSTPLELLRLKRDTNALRLSLRESVKGTIVSLSPFLQI